MIKLIFPCDYVGITQGFKSSHKAIDMGWSTKDGGPNHVIYAPYDGVVTYVKDSIKGNDKSKKTYGNYIKINHGNGLVTLMAHLKYDTISVKFGDKVKQGQKIGIMGNTGYSFGVHCHYEVILNGERLNPLKYTYFTDRHKVGKNTLSKYKPMKLESEGNTSMDENIKDEEVKKEDKIEIDDTIFEYVCTKTGTYKIHLNENEKLIIKD